MAARFVEGTQRTPAPARGPRGGKANPFGGVHLGKAMIAASVGRALSMWHEHAVAELLPVGYPEHWVELSREVLAAGRQLCGALFHECRYGA